MRFLIDTNGWIAFFENSTVLSERAALLMESESDCFISIASVWEASIKVGLGKLKLPYDLRYDLPQLIEDNGFRILDIALEDAIAVRELPPHHGDPFDRLMAVQASRREMQVISRDPVFDKYGLRRIW